MVGGMGRMEGFLEAAESLLNMPVRLGVPRDMQIDPQATLTNAYVTSIGLLKYGMKKRMSTEARSKQTIPVLRWLERTRQVIEEYF